MIPATYALNRTRWGLRLRSAGENPEATRSLGVAVAPIRWQGVLISGALAGLAGAYLSVEVVNNWREGQTLGLGFIALAALILSNWNPARLIGAAFLFGFALAIPRRLADLPGIELAAAADHPDDPVRGDDRGDGRVRREGAAARRCRPRLSRWQPAI